MDPLTHGLLGTTYASLFNKKRSAMRMAAFCSFTGALAPDLDILIRASNDPMFGLSNHRHFTHSVLMAPLLSLLVALFWWPVSKRILTFWQAYLFTCLGMMTHGMLDAMTNYGTHLFWPLTNARESWSIISIIDPIFTSVLLVCALLAVMCKRKQPFIIAMIFALGYWGLGLYQRESATRIMQQFAHERGHRITKSEVKPSFANLWLWRTQYQSAGKGYIDAVHLSPWAGIKYYGGSSIDIYTPPIDIAGVQAADLEKFHFFSDGWLTQNPNDTNEIGDARFAMLPYQTQYIWAIRLKPDKPNEHVDFVSTRTIKDGDFSKLWHMIQGLEEKE